MLHSEEDSIKAFELLAAIQKGNTKKVQVLLLSGAPVDTVDDLDRTALHIAASQGNEPLVKILLRHEAKITKKESNEGKTPYHLACEFGHLEVLKILLNDPKIKEKSAIVNEPIFSRETSLHLAALNGHMKVVKYLIESGASVKGQKEDEGTALHVAAAAGHQKIVKVLIKSGADVNSTNKSGLTPLHCAALNKWYFDTILNLNRTVPNLKKSHLMKYVAVIDLLTNAGANVNTRNSMGRVPLHFAAEQGHLLLVERLLYHGSEVDAQDGLGRRTALHFAARRGIPAVVRCLLNSGANINLKCSIGKDAIKYAINNGNEMIIWMLTCAGADVKSAFNCLDWSNKQNLIEILLHIGGDINSRNEMGVTPFHKFCKIGDEKDLACLFERFNDINAFYNLQEIIRKQNPFKNLKSCQYVQLLTKFLVKIEIVDGYRISDENMKTIESTEYHSFYSHCTLELKALKCTNVFQQLTFFDILIKPIKQLATCIRNEEFMHALKKNNCEMSVQYYRHWFNYRIEKAIERRNLFDMCMKSLRILCNTLPYDVCDLILDFVHLMDLKNLAKV